MTEKRVLTNGKTEEEMPDYRETGPDGQQKAYVVLTEEERAKGFVRPVRRAYIHSMCGGLTRMGLALCETYARKPTFYGATFCCKCGDHFPVAQFKWEEDNETVGS